MRTALFWIFIIALQVFVFNHLDISAYLTPQVFIILLIRLNLHMSNIMQVLIAFGLGLLIDFFMFTPGVHASASLWLMLFRMSFLSRQDIKEHAANKAEYTLKVIDFGPFAATVLTLVFVYHFYVFWIQSIGAIQWGNLLSTVVVSSLFSLVVIAIIEYVSQTRRGAQK